MNTDILLFFQKHMDVLPLCTAPDARVMAEIEKVCAHTQEEGLPRFSSHHHISDCRLAYHHLALTLQLSHTLTVGPISY